jgi:ADP-ribose pyrophosphatase YjhB (NUDIX family)
MTRKASCVIFVFLKEELFLAERRPEHESIDPGKLALPGEHVEHGESLEQALIRGCREELDVEPTKYWLFFQQRYLTEREDQDCYYYAVTGWKGTIRQVEAGELAWIRLDERHLVETGIDRNAIFHL